MEILSRLLGTIALGVNAALGLFLLGLGFLGWYAGGPMHIELIPVEPESMATTLLLAGLFALASVVLALKKSKAARALLVLWSLVVCLILAGTFFRSAYHFQGEEHFWDAVIVFAGSLGVLVGSLLHLRLGGRSRGA